VKQTFSFFLFLETSTPPKPLTRQEACHDATMALAIMKQTSVVTLKQDSYSLLIIIINWWLYKKNVIIFWYLTTIKRKIIIGLHKWLGTMNLNMKAIPSRALSNTNLASFGITSVSVSDSNVNPCLVNVSFKTWKVNTLGGFISCLIMWEFEFELNWLVKEYTHCVFS